MWGGQGENGGHGQGHAREEEGKARKARRRRWEGDQRRWRESVRRGESRWRVEQERRPGEGVVRGSGVAEGEACAQLHSWMEEGG